MSNASSASGLHTVRQFKRTDSRFELRVTHPFFQVLSVQLLNEIKLLSLFTRRHPFVLDVFNQSID